MKYTPGHRKIHLHKVILGFVIFNYKISELLFVQYLSEAAPQMPPKDNEKKDARKSAKKDKDSVSKSEGEAEK